LFAGTYEGLLKSNDGGQNWLTVTGASPRLPTGTKSTSRMKSPQALSAKLPDCKVYDVRFSKANPISVYVATAQGLFESRDEGITWNRLLTDSRAVDRVTLHPVDPNWLAIQTSSQVYVSEDRGKTWLETRIGGASTRVYDFAFRSSTSRTILAGTSHGLFQSDDAGRTWEPKSSGTPIIPV